MLLTFEDPPANVKVRLHSFWSSASAGIRQVTSQTDALTLHLAAGTLFGG